MFYNYAEKTMSEKMGEGLNLKIPALFYKLKKKQEEKKKNDLDGFIPGYEVVHAVLVGDLDDLPLPPDQVQAVLAHRRLNQIQLGCSFRTEEYL